jgi:hypothetical protein
MDFILGVIFMLYITGVIGTYFYGLYVTTEYEGSGNIIDRIVSKQGKYRGLTVVWIGIILISPVWLFFPLAKYIDGLLRGK